MDIYTIWADKEVINEVPEHVSKRGHNLSVYTRGSSSKTLKADGGLPSNEEMRVSYMEAIAWVQDKMLKPLDMAHSLQAANHYDMPPMIDLLAEMTNSADSDDETCDLDAPDLNALNERAVVESEMSDSSDEDS